MAYKFSPEKADKLENQDRYNEFQPIERLQRAGMRAGQLVVDVGTGTGFYTRAAAQIVGPAGSVIGLDILPEMIEQAQSRGTPDNVYYRVSGETTFPVESDSVDWVVMTNLFHELESPARFFKEVSRVLNTSGRIYLTDWVPMEEEEGPPKEHRVAPEQVKTVITNLNFRILSESTLGTSHYEIVLLKKS